MDVPEADTVAHTLFPMRLLPLARLLRLPNVFTAFADIAMALAATAALAPAVVDNAFVGRGALLLLASGLIYAAGMVWNDYFDFDEDKRDRPFRPLPSGQISRRSAAILGTGLLSVAWVAAVLVGRASAFMALALVVAVLAYDARLKRTSFGPIGMALCRFLNVLLGLSLADAAAIPTATRLHLAACVGVYIVGVTWFARTEERRSDPRVLTRAALVMLVAGLGALAVATRVPPGTSPIYFPYLLVAWGFWIGGPVTAAIRKPTADRVQAAVKRSIFGLVGLDALLACVFVGWPGLAIVLLLVPAILIGRWVYST